MTHRGGALALVALSLLAWLTVPAVPAAADHEPPAESHDAAGAGSVEGREVVEEQTGFPCFRVSRHLFGLRGAGTYEGRTASGGRVVYRGQVAAGGTLNQDGPLQVQVENSEAYYQSPFGTHGTETGGGAGCSPSTVATPVPAAFRVFAAEGTVDSDGDKDVDVLTGQAWVYRLDALGAKVPCVAHGTFARGTKDNPSFGDSRWVAEWTLDEDCVVVGNDAGTPGTGTAPLGTFHTQHGVHEPCFGDVLAGDCPRNIRSEYKQFLPKPGPFLTMSGSASAVVGCDRPVTVTARLTVAGVAEPNVAVTFSVAGPAPSVPPGGVSLTGADGRAGFTFSAAAPGDYVVTARVTYAGQERVATHTVRFIELPPLSVTLTGFPKGQTEDLTTVRAMVRDACGTVSGATVNFRVAWPAQDKPWTGQPTPSTGSGTTDAIGEASFGFNGDRAGRYVVTASTSLGTEQASATHTADLAVNTLKRLGSTPLGEGKDNPRGSWIDPGGAFAYFPSYSDLVKFDLRTFQPVGVLAPAHVGGVESMVFSPDGTRAYAGMSDGFIDELDLTSFQWARTIKLPNPDRPRTPSAVIDPAGRYAYFGTDGNYNSYNDPSSNYPAQVLKVDLATFAIVNSIDMELETEATQGPALMDPSGAAAYFTFEGSGPFSTKVVKIDLATFQRGATALLSGTEESEIGQGVIDPAGEYAYFGTEFHSPGRVVKVNLKTMSRVDAIILTKDRATLGPYPVARNEFDLRVGLMDPAGRFAYFGTKGVIGTDHPASRDIPVRLIRIDLATFQRAEHVDLPPDTENVSNTGVIDPSGRYAYVGVSKADAGTPGPGLVAKIALDRAPSPALAADADGPYATDFETPLTVPAPGVLDNDADADRDPLVAGQASDPVGGSVALNPDGSFTYTPDARFAGTDTFTYTASDGMGYSAPATVSVAVAPPPEPQASSFNYYTNVSLFGGPHSVRGYGQDASSPATAASPSVTCPAGGGADSATDPDGAKAEYGPGVIFGGIWPADHSVAPPSGPLTSSVECVNGEPGHATASTSVGLMPTGSAYPGGAGPGPVIADEMTSTCTARTDGTSTLTTNIVNGILETSYDKTTQEAVTSEPIPVSPPPNYTRTGTIDHVGDSYKVVFNEQITHPDGSRTVNAAHLFLLGPTAVGDMVIGSSTCGAPTTGTPPLVTKAVADFDGNGTTDRSVFRPSTGHWFVQGSPEAVQYGADGDVPVPGDYDGNGTLDTAVYRPSTGHWFVRGGTPEALQYGAEGDIPVPGDYDGNGTTDKAVFRPSTGHWFVAGNPDAVQFGAEGDIPVPGDYNGDGTTDRAVFRPSTGHWFVAGATPEVAHYGTTGDIPVPGDYDGNGTLDKAVFRPSTGHWFISGGTPEAFQYGAAGDIPVPGDYDGNKTTDKAVFRPATGHWFVAGATPEASHHGTTGDIPLPLAPGTRRAFFP